MVSVIEESEWPAHPLLRYLRTRYDADVELWWIPEPDAPPQLRAVVIESSRDGGRTWEINPRDDRPGWFAGWPGVPRGLPPYAWGYPGRPRKDLFRATVPSSD